MRLSFKRRFIAAAIIVTLTGCSRTNDRVLTKLNDEAALNGRLPMNPLRWKVITSAANVHDSTMSTLFGNDIAVQYARSNAQHNYPEGAVLSLVTWKQQEDARWFGGNIPASPQSVEFLSIGTGSRDRPSYAYEKYEGNPLQRNSSVEDKITQARAEYITSLRAAVVP